MRISYTMVLFFRYKETSAKTQRHTKSALQTAQLWPKASPFLTRQAQAKQRLSAKWKSALPFLDLNDDIRRGDTDTSYTKIYARREKDGQDNMQYIMGRIFCYGRLLRIAFMHRLIFCCKFIAVPKFSPVGGRILPTAILTANIWYCPASASGYLIPALKPSRSGLCPCYMAWQYRKKLHALLTAYRKAFPLRKG